MKKLIILFICFIVCAGAVASIYFYTDNKSPVITINSNPKVGCDIKPDDLLEYASASDEHLKFFFVEEHDIKEIVKNKYVTYVAVDEDNHVTTDSVSVELDPKLETYHLELINKDIKTQVGKAIDPNEYVSLKNECGWNINETLSVEGVDYSSIGIYDVKVSAKKYENVEPIYVSIIVGDYESPKIVLKQEEGYDYSGKTFTDEYFNEMVETVEDDKDSSEELIKRVSSNWRSVLKADEDGYVDKVGTFTITYKVVDSDGNSGTIGYKFILE
ncbi:MAG: hypothetical protein Q4E33_05410 [Erysipelotrichaceae bacterium]|nr:hypothetical protein [Erysipelotrichaceae bacterium]